ncbi:MAG TPA: preprotein translocase subunit YajC [Polyangiaceae bacterium]
MHSDHILNASFDALMLQNVGPKAGSAAAAQDSSPPVAGGQAAQPPGLGMTILLPFLILIPFFFFQSRRQKKEQAERAKLKKGDRVVSNAGLIGELVELNEQTAKVKIAPGIPPIEMLASSVSPYVPLDTSTAKKEEKKEKDALQDLKDAKASGTKS